MCTRSGLYECDDSAYILSIVWRSGAIQTRGIGSDGLELPPPRSLLLDIAINFCRVSSVLSWVILLEMSTCEYFDDVVGLPPRTCVSAKSC